MFFFRGEGKIKETAVEKHAGSILSGDLSNWEQCTAAVKKGKEVLSNGVRPGDLNPLLGLELWKVIGIPRMLYGCEVW